MDLGKTISIKAMMHSLYQRGKKDNKLSVPTLYVKTLANMGGPEWALRQIFAKARQVAPCYLVFEDLDSIVDDRVRSYFLNEVDGLQPNDGILMVGSTNHLDRLDPGISKRPSRFDRKYFFPNPDFDQRVQYAEFWQKKLKGNDDIEFPDDLRPAIAKITENFSFAYMQEAFVASLLAIAVRKEAGDVERYAGPHDPLALVGKLDSVLKFDGDDEDPNLSKLILWKEIQKQVKILREEIDNGGDSEVTKKRNVETTAPPRTTLPGQGTEIQPMVRQFIGAPSNPAVPGSFVNWGAETMGNGSPSGRNFWGQYPM